MKEFENNNMNQEMNQEHIEETVQNKEIADDSVGNDNIEKEQPTNNTTQPQDNQQNPYFQGYSKSAPPQYPYWSNNSQQNFQSNSNAQSQNNPPQQNQEYNNPYRRETPYNTNPYSQQTSHNPYNQYQYNRPEQSGGQISYTPSAHNGKKQKNRNSVSKGAVAVVCALTIVLSGCFGFCGTMLANRLNQSTTSVNNGGSVSMATNGNVDTPIVIYKSVEDIATSTGNVGENLTYSQVAAMVKDSVVEIVTEFNNQSVWYQYVTTGAGSGVIISEDGYIITNAHVITDESSSTVADNIIVRLTDGTEHTAQPIAYDSDSDIAIIKIEAEGLTPAQCGDSDNLAVGEELVVVGNPLGELGGSVTNGIVSATEREIQVSGVTMSLIQTNAAVNPGNSGGGMFNMKGQLVGVINAKSSGTGIEGLGFAIPINHALEVSEQLLEYGYVRGKTMIGVSFQDVSSNNYYYYYNIKTGVYVAALSEGYNDKNLKVGDRVIAVNGEEVTSSSDIKAIVTAASVGDVLKFQLYRDNKLMEVEVTCFERVPDAQTNIQFDQETDKQNENNSDSAKDTEDAFSDNPVLPFPGGLEEFFFGGNR